MKSIYLALAAMSGAVLFAGAAPASAATCSADCNTTYSACNTTNGANGQSVCMPKWMQCKKACSGPTATKTTVKTTPVKLGTPVKITKVATAPTH